MYWQKKQRTNVFYCSEVIRLDIETAWNHNIYNPITWMVSARVRFLDESRLFRKPTELMAWYNELVEKYSLNFLKRIITIIHNASFDLSYLLPYIQHYLPKERPYGLQDSPNKIIMYRQGCFEFRCTYRLSNESLAQWSNEMAVDHPKKVGMYDYDRVLYQDSEISRVITPSSPAFVCAKGFQKMTFYMEIMTFYQWANRGKISFRSFMIMLQRFL